MSRLAVAVVIVAGLSACQAWDSRYAGDYPDYGHPGYGYGYPRGPGWYYPYYAGPFGYERHLAHERWLAKERRRRAALHDDGPPESPMRPGGDAAPDRPRPSVKVPAADADAAQARMRAAREQAIEAQRQRKRGAAAEAPSGQESSAVEASRRKKLGQ